MSPFEHGEVFVLDDGGEVTNYKLVLHILLCPSLNRKKNTVVDSIMDDLSADKSSVALLQWVLCGYSIPANRSFFLLFFLKVDLDLGNYERFLDIKLTRDNNITTGKIYQVIGQMSPNPCAIRNCCGEWSYQVKSLLLYFPIFFFLKKGESCFSIFFTLN